MSLSSKTDKPTNYHQRKIKAQHHRHSKSYIKTYWPYIPIVGIIVLGAIVNHYWHVNTTPDSAKLTNYSFFSVLESSLGILALSIFLLRHAFAWHKVFVKGEEFAAKHPLLDILLVAFATFSLVLAHSGAVPI